MRNITSCKPLYLNKWRVSNQLKRILQFTIILIVISSVTLSARNHSQTVSIFLKGTPLENAFKETRQQTNCSFVWTRHSLQGLPPITVSLHHASLHDAVEGCLEGLPLTFNIKRGVVYIKDKVVTPLIKRNLPPLALPLNVVFGLVTDSSGSPLPGVTIYVNGNQGIGTTTDENGRYVLNVPDKTTLVFSMIGFQEQRIPVNGRTAVNIVLLPAKNKLGETVVVAFGTKKKSDLVGSVVSINPSDLKVPSSNLTTALAGRVPGMIAFQRSGEPGKDNAQFFIRGVTTFGYKKDPLILIDGMEATTTDLARLQVDDIASFSILKDATATALYGSRAANGVILITTKEGKVGRADLSFRVENSVSSSTRNIQLADPVTYMKLSNEATLTRNPLGALLYSDEKIENTAEGWNPVVYPANDWRKIMFKNYTMNQRFNMSVDGGGRVARYYVSGSYNRDNGLMKVAKRNNFNSNINLNSYSLRSNVNINLTKTTELTVRLSGSFDDYKGPITGGAAMYDSVMHSNPVLFPAYYPVDSQHTYVKHIMFGNYAQGQYTNPYADMVKGYKQYSRSLMLAQLELKQNLNFVTKGLSFNALLNTNRGSYFDVTRSYKPFWYAFEGYDKVSNTLFTSNINPNDGTEYLNYTEGQKTDSTSFYVEARLDYNRMFNKNAISGLLVFQAQTRLNANAGTLQQSLPYRNLGVSGRASYSYDNRYYVQFDFGYNGSERFDADHRFGFFPSLGVAWTVSNEKFFKKLKPVISNLRFRVTDGVIGNDAIGSSNDRFFYLSEVNMADPAKAATFGRGPGNLFSLSGISVSRYADPDITWEIATEQNYALELGLFDKLNLEVEYYRQYRDNILMTRTSIPLAAGFSAPIRANVGAASGKGVDISLNYKQYFNDRLWLSVMGNYTYAASEYRVYEEPKYAENYRSHIGNSIYQQYGYIAEKLFVDDAEATYSPKQNFGPYGGGDIKYLDVNRDGQITEADKVPIGNPTLPKIVYGFGFSIGYGNLDFSAFFQGLAGESFWIDPAATWPFANNTALLKSYADSHWSEGNQNIYALFPRLSPTVNQNDVQTSTWWMRNGSFLRLKQIEFGYTLPPQVQKRMHLSNCRIYVNASNLFSFDHFKLWDVEMGGNGLGYPIQRVLNIGMEVNLGL